MKEKLSLHITKRSEHVLQWSKANFFTFFLTSFLNTTRKKLVTLDFSVKKKSIWNWIHTLYDYWNFISFLIQQTWIEISYIQRDLITVIFYCQISLKPLKTLSLSQVSFPLLFPLYYIVPWVFTNSDKGKNKRKKIL